MNDNATEDTRISRKVPSLTQFCQRAIIANINAVSSLGDNISMRLVRPILVACNAKNLVRLEDESPWLVEHTSDLWKDLCCKDFPIITQQMQNDHEEPESWRDCLFRLKEEEAKRLEQTTNRLRSQRLEDEERKRKRQVKLTDQLPKAKRPRRGRSTGPAPPQTLIEKTRKEATRIQKCVLGSRVIPLPPSTVTKRSRPGATGSQLVPKTTGPVPITTVTVRKPMPLSATGTKIKSKQPACPPPPSQNSLDSRKKPLTVVPPASCKPSPSPFLKPSPSLFPKSNPSSSLKLGTGSFLESNPSPFLMSSSSPSPFLKSSRVPSSSR